MHTRRIYRPTEDEIVYHYCSPDVFNLICREKKLRWSSILTMNDSMELEWGLARQREIFNRLADQGKFGDMAIEFLNSISYGHALTIQKMGTVAVCFSRKEDSLSQWRAYAADGYGFAIGFRASDMIEHPEFEAGFGRYSALEVLYDVAAQNVEIEEHLVDLYRSFKTDIDHNAIDYYLNCETMTNSLIGYKNPAFEEESEIRLIERIQTHFYPDVGFAENADLIFSFTKAGVPSLYFDREFMPDSVRSVRIGPKNPSTDEQLGIYLNAMGITDAEIVRSGASYR